MQEEKVAKAELQVLNMERKIGELQKVVDAAKIEKEDLLLEIKTLKQQHLAEVIEIEQLNKLKFKEVKQMVEQYRNMVLEF